MQHRSSEASQRVEAIPGIGVIGASAIVATVADPTIFRSGRDFAAWIGLVPRQDSTGGKQKLGPISKQGDRYLSRAQGADRRAGPACQSRQGAAVLTGDIWLRAAAPRPAGAAGYAPDRRWSPIAGSPEGAGLP